MFFWLKKILGGARPPLNFFRGIFKILGGGAVQNHGNRGTPILKYLNYSENNYKKKYEYFSI